MLEGTKIPPYELGAAVFIIDISPKTATDVCLIAHHIFPFYKRSILYTAIDHPRTVISGESKQTPEFKVLKFIFRAEVVVFSNVGFTIPCYYNPIVYFPSASKLTGKHFPALEGLPVEKLLGLFCLLGQGNMAEQKRENQNGKCFETVGEGLNWVLHGTTDLTDRINKINLPNIIIKFLFSPISL